MVRILMISAKMATLGLLKIKVFENKDYHVIKSLHVVINKALWCDSNYLVEMVNWPKFGKSSISMKEVVIISFFKDLTKKPLFWGVALVQVQ